MGYNNNIGCTTLDRGVELVATCVSKEYRSSETRDSLLTCKGEI